MMVEPNRTKTMKTSAPVIISRRCAPLSTGSGRPRPINFVRTGAVYRSVAGAVVKRASQTLNQAAGGTKLPACPNDFSFAAAWAAAPRSVMGPTRTLYRNEGPEPPDNT
jgi:hypothetical protein